LNAFNIYYPSMTDGSLCDVAREFEEGQDMRYIERILLRPLLVGEFASPGVFDCGELQPGGYLNCYGNRDRYDLDSRVLGAQYCLG